MIWGPLGFNRLCVLSLCRKGLSPNLCKNELTQKDFHLLEILFPEWKPTSSWQTLRAQWGQRPAVDVLSLATLLESRAVCWGRGLSNDTSMCFSPSGERPSAEEGVTSLVCPPPSLHNGQVALEIALWFF